MLMLDFYSASLLKQQSAGRHVSPLRHIIQILSQPVFPPTPQYGLLRKEQANNNIIIVFGLILAELRTTIYHTGGEHADHSITDAVLIEIN